MMVTLEYRLMVNFTMLIVLHSYISGFIPEYEVDHRNGVCNDNHWSNLRYNVQNGLVIIEEN